MTRLEELEDYINKMGSDIAKVNPSLKFCTREVEGHTIKYKYEDIGDWYKKDLEEFLFRAITEWGEIYGTVDGILNIYCGPKKRRSQEDLYMLSYTYTLRPFRDVIYYLTKLFLEGKIRSLLCPDIYRRTWHCRDFHSLYDSKVSDPVNSDRVKYTEQLIEPFGLAEFVEYYKLRTEHEQKLQNENKVKASLASTIEDNASNLPF